MQVTLIQDFFNWYDIVVDDIPHSHVSMIHTILAVIRKHVVFASKSKAVASELLEHLEDVSSV